MGAFARSYDWSTSSLGPVEAWPQTLKTAVDIALGSQFSMMVVWGPEHIQIYNDAMRDMIGGKHPAAFGAPARETWPEIWGSLELLYSEVKSGEPVTFADQLWFIERGVGMDKAYFTGSHSPIHDEDGRVVGILSTVFETTQRVEAESQREQARAAAQLAHARTTAVLESITDGFFGLDADYCFTYVNTAAEGLLGESREALIGRNIWEAYPANLGTRVEYEYRRVMAERTPTTFENFYAPWSRWFEVRVFPTDRGGLAVYFADITARKHAAEIVRKNEEHLRLALAAAQMGSWEWDTTANVIKSDAAYRALMGLPPGNEPLPPEVYWARMLPEDSARSTKAMQAAIFEGKEFESEQRILNESGHIRWLLSRGRARPDDRSRVIGVGMDITARKRSEQANMVLIAELQHRTRNLLAVVRSIAAQTLRTSNSLDQFRAQFNERLAALSRVQSLLSKNSSHSITIGELVRLEISALGAKADGRNITIDGPNLPLPTRFIQTAALAIHELATNALKYGALTTPEGRLLVTFSVKTKETGPFLSLKWTEHGVSMPPDGVSQRRRGYGRELIETALPYELDAQTKLEFGPDGVICTIDIPLQAEEGQPTTVPA